MWRLGGLLALLAATTNAQDVPRPTRLRIYEVRTALGIDAVEAIDDSPRVLVPTTTTTGR